MSSDLEQRKSENDIIFGNSVRLYTEKENAFQTMLLQNQFH